MTIVKLTRVTKLHASLMFNYALANLQREREQHAKKQKKVCK